MQAFVSFSFGQSEGDGTLPVAGYCPRTQVVETSLLPGRVLASLADLNSQPTNWLPRADRCTHRTVRALSESDRIDADRARVLPPVGSPGWWRPSPCLPCGPVVRFGLNADRMNQFLPAPQVQQRDRERVGPVERGT